MSTVGIVGMTHLGLVSAAAIAARGCRTICYDADPDVIDRLRRGALPVSEPGLPELVRGNADRQVFTADPGRLGACDIVYVAPDVPTDDAGSSDLVPVTSLIEAVVPALATDAVLVILSQVEPGFTRGLDRPAPDRRYYQVETLIFGRAVERAMRPERFIIGCADPAAPLDPRLADLLGRFGCPILPMRYESAELAKISINCCLVASVSVANTLAELCEQIGADWSEIVPALRLDRRIGPHAYLAPGLGIAGGNFERDLATVQRIGGSHGTDTGVVSAWQANSRRRRDWAARTLRAELLDRRPNASIAVWGLTYKENTHSTKNSPSLATIARLPEARLNLHDPAVSADVADHRHAVGFSEPLSCLAGAEALMILTPWPEYRRIAPADIGRALSGRLVLDPYGVLDPAAAAAAGLRHLSLGRPVPRRDD